MSVKTPGQGRTISIHPYEHQLQAAAERRRQPDFPALMAQRPTVERKQAHWNHKGGRRSRYFGLRKNRLQALWSAAVVNIERVMVRCRPQKDVRVPRVFRRPGAPVATSCDGKADCSPPKVIEVVATAIRLRTCN